MVTVQAKYIRYPLFRRSALLLLPAALVLLLGGSNPAAAEPIVGDTVILRALDKVTARTSDLAVPIGESVTFGSITITPRKCVKRPPEETPEVTAFLEITEVEETGTPAPAVPPSEETRVESLPPLEDRSAAPSAGAADEKAAEAGGEAAAGDDGLIHLFTGWMFASSPAINALEHPVYDVWVIDCRISAPERSEGSR